MRSTTLILGLGFTMAANVSAAPLSELAPSTRPLFTPICCDIDASNATGVANVTSGESSNHTHTPDCVHGINGTHNSTKAQGHATEGEEDNTAEATGNPSPYPAFSATDYPHSHTAQVHNHTSENCSHPSHHNSTTSPYPAFSATDYPHSHTAQAHNHTSENCSHPSHHNSTTSTSATHDKTIHPKMLNASAESTHQHTGYRCAHPTHHNGTIPTGHSYAKKSLSPRVDVTVCLGADCQESEVVTANINSAGDLTGMNVKDSKGTVMKRQDREFSYEDIARQMSGSLVAGGV